MDKKIKVGILRETKIPPDRRVALPPSLCIELCQRFPDVEIYVQPSELRAYKDDEYESLGINMQKDLSKCDILIGIKEVDKSTFVANKTYIFFAHVGKMQHYNQKMMQTMVEKKLTLIDYEYLTDVNDIRLVAFGRWAGIVGTYNAFLGWGLRTGDYSMRRAIDCHDMKEFFTELRHTKLGPVKILVTGGGRVSHGAMEVLEHLLIRKISSYEYLHKTFDEPVYCQLEPWDYVERKDSNAFDFKHFAKHPHEYHSSFIPYTEVTDLLITAHFWDPRSPKFFTAQEMQKPEFKIRLIADISCDIDGPIPSTLRSSTIAEPFYGYNVHTSQEGQPFDQHHITIMAVDNLPGEAPRDASLDFGLDLIIRIFPSLFGEDSDNIIERATILKDGELTHKFRYLECYARGE